MSGPWTTARRPSICLLLDTLGGEEFLEARCGCQPGRNRDGRIPAAGRPDNPRLAQIARAFAPGLALRAVLERSAWRAPPRR